MKWFAGVMPLLGLFTAMPLFGAAPIVRSSVQDSPQIEVNRPAALPVEDRLQLMERRMQALTDILMRLDRIQQEIQQLRGDVELQGHGLESVKKRQRDLYGDMDRRVMQLSTQQVPAASTRQPPVAAIPSADGMPAATAEVAAEHVVTPLPTTSLSRPNNIEPLAGKPPLTSPPGAALQTAEATSGVAAPALDPVAASAPVSALPVVPPADPALEQPMYKQAFDLLMQRRYDEAKQAFRAFLRQYPDGRLAANAQYWVGEASYVTRDFVTALDEFTRVVQNYPTSPKVSDSLLKIAFIQYEQKEWAKSRETLESIVNQYATTTAARLAKKRLERMRIEGN